MSAFRFQRFSEGRWLGVGQSCRCVISAWLCGLDAVVDLVIKDSRMSNYHINGYSGLTTECREYMIAEAYSSYLCESLHLMVMEDNRVLLHVPDLLQTAIDEFEWLAGLDSTVWCTLAKLCDTSAQRLRHDILAAAHAAFGFVSMRIFEVAASYPFSLTQGNIADNLHALAGLQEPPLDTISWKIWTLLQAESRFTEVLEGVRLLRELPWSTKSVEEQHASVSLMSRHHPEYSEVMLQERATLHTLRKLMPKPSPEQQLVQKLEMQLQKLQRRRPGHIFARQAFCKALCDLAISKKGSDPRFTADVTKVIFKKHGDIYERLPDHRKTKMAKLATVLSRERQAQLEEEIQLKTAALTLAIQREAMQKAEIPPIMMSSAQLTLDEIQGRFSTTSSSTPGSARSRSSLQEGPAPASENLLEKLKGVELMDTGPEVGHPAWMAKVVHNRDVFSSSVWLAKTDDTNSAQAFVFLFAMQQPYHIQFAPVDVTEHFAALPPVGADNWDDIVTHAVSCAFTLHPGLFTPWHKFPRVPDEQILVILNACYSSNFKVTSKNPAQPLNEILQTLSDPRRVRGSGHHGSAGRDSRSDWKKELVKAHPWIEASLRQDKKRKKADDTTAASSSQEPMTDEPDAVEFDPLTDQAIENIFQELEQRRDELKQDEAVSLVDFYPTVLGGQWTHIHRGRTYDAYQGKVRQGSGAVAWLTHYGLASSMRFSVEMFGEHAASVLAQEWCHRMQYFYNEYVASGTANLVYDEVTGCRLQTHGCSGWSGSCSHWSCPGKGRFLVLLGACFIFIC